jgi:hypothetical protein
MTERKPPGVSFETWADKQIRDAERRGEFAALEGAGKPLKSLDEPYDELWWVRRKMHSEGLAALPPTLALRKEAEDAAAAVQAAATEAQVRRILAEINGKLAEVLRCPPPGPPLGRGLFDVEQTVAEWRAAHPVPEPASEPADPAPLERRPHRGLGRLFRRRGRAARNGSA